MTLPHKSKNRPRGKGPAVSAPANPRRFSTNPLGRIIVEVIAAIFMVSLTVPWQPGSLKKIGPQEYSWMLLMQHAAATGMQFGQQIVMPEGPLAFLGNDVYEPRTYPVLILARTIIALVAFWSLQELGRRIIRTWPVALLWLMAVILLMGTTPDCFFPDCAILLLLNYFLVGARKLRPSAIAMMVILGAASLIKTNQLLYSVIAVGVLTIDQALVRRSRFYLPACIYLASIALFYLLARQSPGNVGTFIAGWWLVLIGHANAAALPGPKFEPIVYILIVFGTLVLIGRSEWKARGRAAACPLAGIAAILLLLYKHSFVRQDEWHTVIAPTTALTLLILYVPAMWRASGKGWRVAGTLMTVFSALFLWLLLICFYNFSTFDYTLGPFQKSGQNLLAAAEHLTDPDRLTRQWESDRRSIRQLAGLPRDKIVGTVDVYPHWQDVVFAYDLPYAPRPVCCSFVANTPALAALNAQYLAGPDAPETILFNCAAVDEKYPTMLDGASIPELLARYDLVDGSGRLLILRRATVPLRYVFQPLMVRSARFNEVIPVPDSPGEMIWARIIFKKHATYGLISAVYQPATLAIIVATANGRVTAARLVPDVAGQGFLLSPMMNDRFVLASLYRGKPDRLLAENTVKGFTIRVFDPSLGIGMDPEFTVIFERLLIVPGTGK
jgi:hypothetical protein